MFSFSKVIKTCKANGTKIGICGQGPSDYPDFAQLRLRDYIIPGIKFPNHKLGNTSS